MGTERVDEAPSKRARWITPFMKQCFVTSGVSLNMAASGLVVGFGAALLSQLKASDPTTDSSHIHQANTSAAVVPSNIHADASSLTWLASLPGFFMFTGNFLVVPIMAKFGRRAANLFSISLLTFSWTCILFAPNVVFLLVARALQGVYMGMSTALGSLLIGEYTSPKNRGAFLMTISVSISVGVLVVHAISSVASWRICAMICAIIAVVDLCIVVMSPESPSWLASQGRYEDCKRVFRWLRGDTEEDELKKMIEASIVVRESKVKADDSSLHDKVRKRLAYFKDSIRKKEFFKPLLIMFHIYTIAMWGGVNILVVYIEPFIHATSGNVNVRLWTVSLDIQRIISNMIAIYIVKKIRRRIMLFSTVGIDIFALLSIAAYTYARTHYGFDYQWIGFVLTHLMMFAIATGTLSLSFIIAGEIFPLEFKTLAGGISMLAYSSCLFIALKTTMFWFETCGVPVTCCLSALVLTYCVGVAWFLLPETKDRTLLEIEEEFRGKPLSRDPKSDSKVKNSIV